MLCGKFKQVHERAKKRNRSDITLKVTCRAACQKIFSLKITQGSSMTTGGWENGNPQGYDFATQLFYK